MERRDSRSEYRYPAAGTDVFFRVESPAPAERRFVQASAEDIGPGGLFLALRHPPRPGTVLRLQIYGPADPEGGSAVHARAVVRWRRLWGDPKGVGLQFLEVEDVGRHRLAAWLDTIALPLEASPCVSPALPESASVRLPAAS